MKKLRQLTLPQPCAQNWNKMDDRGTGRHCSQCSTTVHDFSILNDKELVDALVSGKHHCGRFREDQLNVWYETHSLQLKRTRYWPAIAAALVAGFFTVQPGFNQVQTPGHHPFMNRYELDARYAPSPQQQENNPDVKMITIRVVNAADSAGIYGVLITIGGKEFKADAQGYLSIPTDSLSSAKMGTWIHIRAERAGYLDKSLQVKSALLYNREYTIALKRKKYRVKHIMGCPAF